MCRSVRYDHITRVIRIEANRKKTYWLRFFFSIVSLTLYIFFPLVCVSVYSLCTDDTELIYIIKEKKKIIQPYKYVLLFYYTYYVGCIIFFVVKNRIFSYVLVLMNNIKNYFKIWLKKIHLCIFYDYSAIHYLIVLNPCFIKWINYFIVLLSCHLLFQKCTDFGYRKYNCV